MPPPPAPPPGPTFSARLQAAATPIWQRQATHPFLRGLADGTLPAAKFLFYTRQDVLFLREMNRVFAYAAARADSDTDMGQFARLLLDTQAILADLHGRYATSQGLLAADLAHTRPALITYSYARHLLATALADSYPAVIAALLPSMWMYDALGQDLAAHGPPPPDHPYREWLAVHAGPHLEQVTTWLRATLDARAPSLAAAEQDHLVEVFLISSRYEILFWEMAWREEEWP
ncbi:MAG TPA: thiaminase II [Chloroflexia bacterium]|nr:thiaminase II [Chloroflexia bacterium]